MALAQRPECLYRTPPLRPPGFEALAACSLTSGAAERTLLELSYHSVLRGYPTKTAIYWEGDKADAIYILISGSVRLTSRCPDGRVHSSRQVALLDVFGETASLGQQRREHTAWTVGEVRVWEIDGTAFRHALKTDPALCLAVVHHLVDSAMNQVNESASKTTPLHRRLARELLANVQTDALVRVTHSDLANYLGVSREAITRSLARLKALKLVNTHRGGIEIRDSVGLKRLVTRDDIRL